MVSEGKAHRHKRSRQAGFLFFCLAGEQVCVVPGGLGGRNQPMEKPPSKRHWDAKPRDVLCFYLSVWPSSFSLLAAPEAPKWFVFGATWGLRKQARSPPRGFCFSWAVGRAMRIERGFLRSDI